MAGKPIALATMLLLTACELARHPYYAFVDRTGNVKIRLEPGQFAGSFSEGLAAVSVNGRWGYIDRTGRVVIPPRFGFAGEFSEGLAVVTMARQEDYWSESTVFGYIDKRGEFVIPPRFHWAQAFSEGLAPVCEGRCRGNGIVLANHRAGYIDRKGAYAIPRRFQRAGRFSEGRAWVTDPAPAPAAQRDLRAFPAPSAVLLDAQHLIDKSGRRVAGATGFTAFGEYSHGLCATSQGFVDRHGKLVLTWISADMQEGFADGWAAVTEGNRIVFIDTKGEVVLRPRQQHVGRFSEGLAPACDSNCGPSGGSRHWGYIDKTGEYVIPPRYGFMPRSFSEGLALVCFGCVG